MKFNHKRLLLLISIISCLLLSCSQPNDKSEEIISREEIIGMASSQLPPEVLSKSKIYTYFDSEQSTNGIWQVYFYGFNTTREELEEFGWEEGENVSFGDSDEYHGVMIYIDTETRCILSKRAFFIWLGPGPSEVS